MASEYRSKFKEGEGPVLIGVDNAFGLTSKFLSVGKGICSKVWWNAAAPTSFHRGRLEVVHIIGWFLPQAAGVVVLVTKPKSIGIQPRWIIWSQSMLFKCVKLVFLSVFAVSSFWFS